MNLSCDGQRRLMEHIKGLLDDYPDPVTLTVLDARVESDDPCGHGRLVVETTEGDTVLVCLLAHVEKRS